MAVLDRYVIKLVVDRLYEAIEKGFLPLDLSLQERSHKLNARKQELLIQVAGYRRQQQLPGIKRNQLEAFTKALRTKLLDRKSGLGEETKKHSLERESSFVPNLLTKSDKSGNWFVKILV
ncbi:MAG: hypothetical protein E6Q59_01595 [Nitrosomonas sp.]|nr:MAG: hypothetical protein E6Q59_01595 [Nitrosomonas sp.]